jgi:acyl-coenzyme A thioesterase PaaI-like protein
MATATEKSLQETYAPHNACFGCGPSNAEGLRVRSFVDPDGETVVAHWTPKKHHEAFPGVLNGGIIGSLLDCHSNWTAAYFLMKKRGASTPPCTVTSDYTIALKRPCPTDTELTLKAKVTQATNDRCLVEATLEAGGKIRATCTGTFIAVEEGHPAYHRW